MNNNILVINQSDPTLSSEIALTLFSKGFNVASGLDSLAIWSRQEEFKPHLIILGDTVSVDRFEACSLLLQAIEVPVVMLGETLGADVCCRAVEAGADCYLETPSSYPELVDRVNAILRRCYKSYAVCKSGTLCSRN